MKKPLIRTLSALLALTLLTGCASGQTAAPESRTTKTAAEETAEGGAVPCTFTDALGREITVTAPKRVAALLGSFAQIWMLAGGTVCATADDAWIDLGLELPEDTVNLGSMRELSLELLLSSRPDLILASTGTRQHLEWQETLEATGIPLAYFDVSNFEDYLALLKLSTELTGQPDRYAQYGTAVQTQIEAVRQSAAERNTHPSVLCIRASASLIAIKGSKDNVLGEILNDLGCVNIADADERLLENISVERILEADPDYIFLVQRGDDAEGMKRNVENMMAENPAWQQLTAVKEGRMYYMEKNLYNMKPNQRWGEAYEKLEEILSHG